MQREKNNNFILDFTGVYDDEFAKEKTSLTWIDCTDITGCDMYVSDEAEKQIGERVLEFMEYIFLIRVTTIMLLR